MRHACEWTKKKVRVRKACARGALRVDADRPHATQPNARVCVNWGVCLRGAGLRGCGNRSGLTERLPGPEAKIPLARNMSALRDCGTA